MLVLLETNITVIYIPLSPVLFSHLSLFTYSSNIPNHVSGLLKYPVQKRCSPPIGVEKKAVNVLYFVCLKALYFNCILKVIPGNQVPRSARK